MVKTDKEQLFFKNENLIYYVLKKLGVYHLKDELYDAGVVGLMKGINSYNPDLSQPTTYLYRCIANEIMMTFRKKKLDVVSIYTEIDENITLEDYLPSDYNLEYEVEKQIVINNIYHNLKYLTEMERDVVTSYFGVFGKERMSQKLLSEKYNTSQANISRIKDRALKKIRKMMKNGNTKKDKKPSR